MRLLDDRAKYGEARTSAFEVPPPSGGGYGELLFELGVGCRGAKHLRRLV